MTGKMSEGSNTDTSLFVWPLSSLVLICGQLAGVPEGIGVGGISGVPEGIGVGGISGVPEGIGVGGISGVPEGIVVGGVPEGIELELRGSSTCVSFSTLDGKSAQVRRV